MTISKGSGSLLTIRGGIKVDTGGNGGNGGWLGDVVTDDNIDGEKDVGRWQGGGGGEMLSIRKHFALLGRGGGFLEGLELTGPKAEI